jgi:hypothetical protein
VSRSQTQIALALLVAPKDADVFRLVQTGSATHFPPHITIRGRFESFDHVALNEILACSNEILCKQLPICCSLQGPVRVHPCLQWLEIPPRGLGHDHVCDLHRQLNDALLKNKWIAFDAVSRQHSGTNFRPHLTLAWTDKPPFTATSLPQGDCRTNLVSWCAFVYGQSVHEAPVVVLDAWKSGERTRTEIEVKTWQGPRATIGPRGFRKRISSGEALLRRFSNTGSAIDTTGPEAATASLDKE